MTTITCNVTKPITSYHKTAAPDSALLSGNGGHLFHVLVSVSYRSTEDKVNCDL